jgi:glycosyltransferase involved in cell wall biosynthesis
MMVFPPRLSIVVPARNAGPSLAACLEAARRSAGDRAELIVVDDGSTDTTADIATSAGAIVVRRSESGGPAAARNAGVARASAEIVLFLDADVIVAEDGVTRVLRAFETDPSLAAVFGSYDSTPSGGTVVSDYRNLLHHFVHQSAREDSQSFWAGCGAVRKRTFLSVGGFDERFDRPSIEDIEFGGRLARAGHRIRLDKHLQVCHQKRWTLRSLVTVDVRDRAYPWARLILRDGGIPNDLNLRHTHRASAVLVWLAVVATTCLIAGWPRGWDTTWALAAAAALAVVGVLNRDFHAFMLRQRGLPFAVIAFLLHALYYAYASATFAWALLRHVGRGLGDSGQRVEPRDEHVSPRALR